HPGQCHGRGRAEQLRAAAPLACRRRRPARRLRGRVGGRRDDPRGAARGARAPRHRRLSAHGHRTEAAAGPAYRGRRAPVGGGRDRASGQVREHRRTAGRARGGAAAGAGRMPGTACPRSGDGTRVPRAEGGAGGLGTGTSDLPPPRPSPASGGGGGRALRVEADPSPARRPAPPLRAGPPLPRAPAPPPPRAPLRLPPPRARPAPSPARPPAPPPPPGPPPPPTTRPPPGAPVRLLPLRAGPAPSPACGGGQGWGQQGMPHARGSHALSVPP